MSEVEITHDETLHYTGQVAAKVAKLTLAFVKDVDAVLRSEDSDASAPASAAGATKSSS